MTSPAPTPPQNPDFHFNPAQPITLYNFAMSPFGIKVHAFLLFNRGDGGAVTLKGPRPVTIAGPHAKDFKVVRQPRGRILGPGSSRFEIRFSPQGEGARTATVSVRSAGGTYVFAVGGR